MGIGPIPRSAILAYASEFGIRSRDEFYQFYRIIQAMDQEYLARANATSDSVTPIESIEGTKAIFHQLQVQAKATESKRKRKQR